MLVVNKFLITLLILSSTRIVAQNPIIVPDTLTGTNFDLILQYGTHQFYSGTNTSTMGANGNILGPTLIFNQGDSINISINNQLSDTTTIHWHGLHVSPENDGGPHTTIAPGATWKPGFTVRDMAATYWYHPHLHMKTNEHVSKGIAGIIIVRDSEEAALALPRSYGIDDFPLVIQTKDFDGSNEIVVPSNADDVIMVNATISGTLDVPQQVVRLRILNGSSMRVFNLGLSQNQTFYQIASDGGLLSNSLPLTRLLIAPGERAEILVDFDGMQGQSTALLSYASELPNGIYGATNPGQSPNMTLTGYNPNPLNGTDFEILQLNVVATTQNPITTIASTLVSVVPIVEGDADLTRTLTMSPVSMGMNQLNGDFVINNVAYDLDVINYEVPLDNTEVWSISNQSAIAHPFHIHDVQFYVLDRNGSPPPANEQGRKDVILVKSQETVRFIARFENFSSSTVPYMYHCHMLYHEDRGMMGQFLVKDRITSLSDFQVEENFTLYPNPANNLLYLNLANELKVDNIQITDLQGKTVKIITDYKAGDPIDISGLPNAVYIIKILSPQGEIVKRLIIQ